MFRSTKTTWLAVLLASVSVLFVSQSCENGSRAETEQAVADGERLVGVLDGQLVTLGELADSYTEVGEPVPAHVAGEIEVVTAGRDEVASLVVLGRRILDSIPEDGNEIEAVGAAAQAVAPTLPAPVAPWFYTAGSVLALGGALWKWWRLREDLVQIVGGIRSVAGDDGKIDFESSGDRVALKASYGTRARKTVNKIKGGL